MLSHNQGEQQPPLSRPVYCGQTAEWIKMPLGLEACLGPGHILIDGNPASPERDTAAPPLFGPCLLWRNGRPSQLLLSTSYCHIALYYDNIIFIANPVLDTKHILYLVFVRQVPIIKQFFKQKLRFWWPTRT